MTTYNIGYVITNISTIYWLNIIWLDPIRKTSDWTKAHSPHSVWGSLGRRGRWASAGATSSWQSPRWSSPDSPSHTLPPAPMAAHAGGGGGEWERVGMKLVYHISVLFSLSKAPFNVSRLQSYWHTSAKLHGWQDLQTRSKVHYQPWLAGRLAVSRQRDCVLPKRLSVAVKKWFLW